MKSIIPKQTVLITGGAGFIGANLTRKMLDLGYNLHLITRKSSDTWRIKNIIDKIKLHEVSLGDQKELKELAHRINPTAIFHLATYSNYRDQEKILEMAKVNIISTVNLLLATRDIPYQVFVNTGSSSEYGFKKKAMKESDLLEPNSFYAATKASATLLCQTFAFYYNKPIVTLRPFSVYGPHEERTRFIPTIMRALSKQSTIKLTSGKQRRDFIFVDDVVDAYIKTLSAGSKLKGKILNIGTGKQYTNDEVVKKLFMITQKKVTIKKGAYPARIWDSPYWVASISEAKKTLKWSPKHSLGKGLLKTYNWFVSNGQI